MLEETPAEAGFKLSGSGRIRAVNQGLPVAYRTLARYRPAGAASSVTSVLSGSSYDTALRPVFLL